MGKRNFFVIITLCSLIFSCGNNTETKKKYFSIKTLNDQTKFKIGETVVANIVNNKKIKIDSVTFFLEETRLSAAADNILKEKVDTEKLGKHLLKALSLIHI